MIGMARRTPASSQQSLVRRRRLVAMRGRAHGSDLRWSEPDGTGRCVAELTPAATGSGACAPAFCRLRSQIVIGVRPRAVVPSAWARSRGPSHPDRLPPWLISMSLCSVPDPVATSRRSARRSSARRSPSSRSSTGAVSASTSAASRARRCCKNAELAHTLTHEKARSTASRATPRWPSARRTPAAARSPTGIVKGVHFLMKKNKIEEIDGWGTLTAPASMDVALNDGDDALDHLRQPHHRHRLASRG